MAAKTIRECFQENQATCYTIGCTVMFPLRWMNVVARDNPKSFKLKAFHTDTEVW